MKFLSEPIITEATVLLTDSRFVSQPAQSIFFAIKGEHHDGHQFIDDLYQKGVREFVVEKKAATNDFQNHLSKLVGAKFWLVENAIRALQNLSAEHRQKFDIPVIGVTGSNGKTIVKEWLGALLKDDSVVKSPRSYNSQLGVPLSVWEMNENHTLGIFEAGISKSGEMEYLEPIIRPSIGIFTNIGSAHDEGFRSRKQKATEKLRLFQRSKTLIYCKDYEDIDDEIRILLKAVNPSIELIGWSRKAGAKIYVNATKLNSYSTLQILWNSKIYDFKIPFVDDASIENATHCIFLMLHQTINVNVIQNRLDALKPIAMRLELKQGINDCYLIDDTYNNDYAGLSVALNFMSQQHTKRSKVLIISDLLQSGLEETELYESIGDLIKGKEIDQIIGIGEVISRNQKYFKNGVFYHSTEEFLEKYPINQLQSSLILVKGARKFEFEKIINRLIHKVHGTVFEVNLDALTNNLNFYRNKVGSGTKIMVMVKAFAYGSGSAEVASLLEYHRVDYLGVAYTDEGVVLRQNGIKLPIMVLNPQPESFSKLVEYKLEPEIYSFKLLNQYLDFISSTETTFKIHLKLDTGMHRLGFEEQDIEALIGLLKENPQIEIASIFSHLVGADESEHNAFSKTQIEKFDRMSKQIITSLNSQKTLRHICNSAGIIRFPDAKFDMVRLGIGLYGVEVTGSEQKSLQTVGTLKTVISQIKNLKAGETIGYSRKGILEKDSRIATIAIGYADGFDRGFSKGVGKVLVNGVACPVVGNVCMDMTMIDITDAICEEGDEVIIFGKDLSIRDLADSIGTITYEILTGVSERVKRVFYKE
ncbi:Alanine racemase [Emticicia aquatica]|uniref:Alanine racemase n=1 Tax=Emticicia aquatica TaxID=1681835 RepID=A0ABM9AJZ6_9BACT|nr:bifunctional UDP-N-acetylmuramoyl-tripeptide:D-alanyl-D-alanine ligase/alanine racemase [Emticicia aquatica]CAH0994069.1 Alanine racemase [Emticicia aquatica]